MGQLRWRLTVAMALLLWSALPAHGQDEPGAAPVLVFFDWGKPEIGGDAAAVLDAVAASVRATPALRLRLSGHSDRSGGTTGNRRSASRRADAVAAYLAERGVPRRTMTLASFGEEQPLIPTEDGVREPQNRRVEIQFARTAAQ
ncbi:MAG: OmpA family protein [Pseudomonadota bacterium]|nr:OmpA family protein [Pseudomonadota bacterium]